MSKTAVVLPLFLSLVLGSCEALQPLLPPPPEELDLWSDAAAGVTQPELAALCRDVWQSDLRHDPFQATFLGDPRFHSEIPDTSREARAAWKARQRAFLDRLTNIERRSLAAEDRTTAKLLNQKLRDEIELAELGLEDWTVDPLAGPHVRMLNVAAVQPRESERQRAQLVARWQSFPSYLRQAARNLEYGLVDGRVASRTAVEKAIHQLDELLAVPPCESPLVKVATGDGRWIPLPAGSNLAAVAHEQLGDARDQAVLMRLNRHLLESERTAAGSHVLLPSAGDELGIEERGAFVYDVLLAVEMGVYPALRTYHDVLSKKILPAARDDERSGLKYLSGGASLYRTLIHQHTTLPVAECDPKELHEFGLSEVLRIREEIGALGAKVFGTSDVRAIQARLRSDPALHFQTREEVLATASSALARARGKLRGFFGEVPATPCEVVPVPAYEEQDSTIAYYREPAADGSRPGRYYVNTSAPETRPRYEAEVLAFHEAIPGHHLQIALASELEDLPRFRRHLGVSAYAEGWALYTERLCEEMGLYTGDLDRLGMLSFDAWRASRLVVDTGIHAFGWGREEAIEYLAENTLLATNNVENEVDRYIAWPGQALAYKVGQREILALRERARETFGTAFRYPEFHARVLGNGALTLSTLRAEIERWIGGAATEPVEASAAR